MSPYPLASSELSNAGELLPGHRLTEGEPLGQHPVRCLDRDLDFRCDLFPGGIPRRVLPRRLHLAGQDGVELYDCLTPALLQYGKQHPKRLGIGVDDEACERLDIVLRIVCQERCGQRAGQFTLLWVREDPRQRWHESVRATGRRASCH